MREMSRSVDRQQPVPLRRWSGGAGAVACVSGGGYAVAYATDSALPWLIALAAAGITGYWIGRPLRAWSRAGFAISVLIVGTLSSVVAVPITWFVACRYFEDCPFN